MKKYLFLNAEDRRPVQESGYRYKKSKPVTAVKTKRDEDGFFIPWAMFRPLGEKGLLCELFGASPNRKMADILMNRDLLMKEAYEHEVELLMCRIRKEEIRVQRRFCAEDQILELYQQSKIQEMPTITPEHKRKARLDAITWKYDCIQQYKKSCFQFAEAVAYREWHDRFQNLNQKHFVEQFIQKANELPEANRILLDLLYEAAWRTIFVFKYGDEPEDVTAPWYDKVGGEE